jgi:hypothetical protein
VQCSSLSEITELLLQAVLGVSIRQVSRGEIFLALSSREGEGDEWSN